MLTCINIKEINRLFRYFPNNLNTRSRLYKSGKFIHKIVNFKITDEFIDILKTLNEKNYDFIVKPVGLIENEGVVVGYTTEFLNQKSMYNLRHRSRNLKKKDLLLAFDLVDKIANNDLIYSDFHPGNVLVDKDFKKLTLCDLDTLRFKKDEESKRNHYLGGFSLLLSYYYNINGNAAITAINNGGHIKYDEDNIFKECIDSIGKKSIKIVVKKLEKINDKDYRRYRYKIDRILKDRVQLGYIKDK